MRQATSQAGSTVNTARAPELDVQGLFLAKNPGLAGRLPPVALRILERVIHQRELRRVIARSAASCGCDFVDEVLGMLRIQVEFVDDHHVPDHPRIVICANHPTGGVDGLVLLHLLCRRFGTVLTPANDLLLALPPLRDSVAAIDKFGSNRGRFSELDAMYASDRPVLVFPAGRTARVRGGRLREFPWEKSVVKYARRHGRPVVPAYVSGRNSPHFYTVWQLRRALGIRLNLEMLLLVDELFRKKNSHVTVRFGPAVPLGAAAGPECDRALAQTIRRIVERDLGYGGPRTVAEK